MTADPDRADRVSTTVQVRARGGFRVVLAALLTLGAAVGTGGCAQRQYETTDVINVGLALGHGGLGDHGPNDLAYQGLLAANQAMNLRFEVLELTTPAQTTTELAALAEAGYDLIIGVGTEYGSITAELADSFPATRFAVVDGTSGHPLVTSVSFRTNEISFVMGALAGMIAEDRGGSVGFVGGPATTSAAVIDGFERGLRHQMGPSATVISRFADSLAEPGQGRELAGELFQLGVIVIYNTASRTGMGVTEAALIHDGFVLGSDGDQRALAPGHAIGGAHKRIDQAVLGVIQGEVQASETVWGINDGGVSFGPFNPEVVTPAIQERFDAMVADVTSGNLDVGP